VTVYYVVMYRFSDVLLCSSHPISKGPRDCSTVIGWHVRAFGASSGFPAISCLLTSRLSSHRAVCRSHNTSMPRFSYSTPHSPLTYARVAEPNSRWLAPAAASTISAPPSHHAAIHPTRSLPCVHSPPPLYCNPLTLPYRILL
jgi:hypothetical protein